MRKLDTPALRASAGVRLIMYKILIAYIPIALFGCKYGSDQLRVLNSETIAMLNHPEENVESISRQSINGVTFLPQVIVRTKNENVDLCVRSYRSGPEVSYKLGRHILRDKKGNTIDGEVLGKRSETSFLTHPDGIFVATVSCLESYKQATFREYALQKDSLMFEFNVDFEHQTKNYRFQLNLENVRYYGGP